MQADGVIDFDPFEPDFHDDPYPRYRMLLENAPVFHNPRHDMWFVARHVDCLAMFRDTTTYSNVTRMSAGFLPMIATMDPPRHDALRAILTGDFTPVRLRRVATLVRDTARELLADLAARQRFDFIQDFATEVPTRVTCALLGVPEEMRLQFGELANRIFATFDAESGLQGNIAEAIYALAEQLIDRKRAEPVDDITSRLLAARIDGSGLTHEELIAYLLQLIVAGFETTRGLLGNTAWLLAQYPEQRRLLRETPDLIPNAIEESLRLESPTPMIFRSARQAVRIGSCPLPEGATLVPIMAAANRDPEAFDDPERFDIRRKWRRPHLAFGAGIHFCLGNHLARLEGTICLEEMLRLLPDWDIVAPDVRRHRTPIARGFLSLPMTLRSDPN